MTKGGNNKPTMLGRLIFGEKRKQHASPSRHRSATRHGASVVDVSSTGGDGANKNPINLHDWAAWRTKLNEQMGNGVTEQADIKQMRQFLQANPFYKQHSRDPSNGRYNGVQLLFSIPHAKLKAEGIEGSQGELNKNANTDVNDRITSDQNNALLINDNHTPTIASSASARSPMIIDKTISQLLPKSLLGNTGGFIHISEQMIAADGAQTHRSIRTPFSASDRVHSTLQKAVKDGNVLEKIKAFEMQAAAAAQAEAMIKLANSTGVNNRIQPTTSTVPSTTHRPLSPTIRHPLEQSVSPLMAQYEPQHQNNRSHRSRYVHPAQYRRDGGNLGPIVGRESRKGAHVLEPAHGDIILKRRASSQKTVNDDDYTITAMSSMALTASPGHQHRQHNNHHHRTSVSRSRHRPEIVHDKRTSNNHENVHKKHQQKQKEATTPSTTKTSSRRRWLKGRKDTPTETENVKQDLSNSKSKQNSKTKKKNNERERHESTKKTTSPTPKGKTSSATSLDNNRVYGVPSAMVNEQMKFEIASPQLPSRIDEENESDREEKTKHTSPKEEDISQSKECEITIERRSSKTKYHKKVSSTDGEILSKVEDDTRFSRPTDDHAHRSELNDEDDEYKSEGDVFIEESSATNINPHPLSSSNMIQRQASQCSIDELSSDRRWQWSKESGGLIDKGNNRKKKQSPSITIVTRKNKIHQDDEHIVYETPEFEHTSTSVSNTHPVMNKQSPSSMPTTANGNEPESSKQMSKQILHAIMNSMNNTNNNQGQSNTDDFFEIGPHTNPEEAMLKMTSSS